VVVLNLASNTSADSRTVELVPAKPCVIGRSSRSKNIVPASDNLLFDCPVVSRFHAELRYSPWQAPDQQVTITDTASLHGTMVNGQRLVPYNEFALKMGDVIKFGERVSRGEGTHLPHHFIPDTIRIWLGLP
jgi:pSer/pThr/pTyr-binding forkhead associated (FHA) protein